MATLQRQGKQLRAADIEAAFVVMPRFSPLKSRASIASAPQDLRILKLDDPAIESYFQLSLWFDKDHFVVEGAEMFSRRLAEALHQ